MYGNANATQINDSGKNAVVDDILFFEMHLKHSKDVDVLSRGLLDIFRSQVALLPRNNATPLLIGLAYWSEEDTLDFAMKCCSGEISVFFDVDNWDQFIAGVLTASPYEQLKFWDLIKTVFSGKRHCIENMLLGRRIGLDVPILGRYSLAGTGHQNDRINMPHAGLDLDYEDIYGDTKTYELKSTTGRQDGGIGAIIDTDDHFYPGNEDTASAHSASSDDLYAGIAESAATSGRQASKAASNGDAMESIYDHMPTGSASFEPTVSQQPGKSSFSTVFCGLNCHDAPTAMSCLLVLLCSVSNPSNILTSFLHYLLDNTNADAYPATEGLVRIVFEKWSMAFNR